MVWICQLFYLYFFPTKICICRRQTEYFSPIQIWSGMYFFDYGNAFLLEARRAGADVSKKGQVRSLWLSSIFFSSAISLKSQTLSLSQAEGSPLFRYPSYVQDIMGDIFSLGFGPFRWLSGDQWNPNPNNQENVEDHHQQHRLYHHVDPTPITILILMKSGSLTALRTITINVTITINISTHHHHS